MFEEASAEFFEHDHVAKQQAADFERLITELPPTHCVMLEDFSMDYAHVHQVFVRVSVRMSVCVCVCV